jgi:hypothetical protein
MVFSKEGNCFTRLGLKCETVFSQNGETDITGEAVVGGFTVENTNALGQNVAVEKVQPNLGAHHQVVQIVGNCFFPS